MTVKLLMPEMITTQVSELSCFQQQGEQNKDIITYIKWEYRYLKGGTK